ncbi:MAG: O-antigen ligase family protein [Clostridia bacterium]|nr:O-antigen ligase family protein [Clostridia bacterium]
MDCKRYIAAIKDLLIRFFGGRYYPPFVCALVLLGYFTGLEVLFGTLNVLLFCLSLWLTDSAKHVLIVAGTFMYQISPGHAPTVPARSDYFFTGIRPYLIALLIIVLFVSFFAYVKRTEVYRSFNFKDCPLILPMLVLAAAFLLNGIGSETYAFKEFLLGFAEAGAYFLFFLLFYFGFRKRDLEKIDSYFCYCTLWIAFVILVQLAILYFTGDVWREDGAINVGRIQLGWGVSTVIGAHLAVLIPVLLYGAMRRRYPIPYFIMACLTVLGCFLSMSRTALGVGALFFGISLLIGCFRGQRKTLFQITSLLIVLFILIAFIGYFEDIRRVFAVYFEKGFESNGRWELWKKCVDNFFDHPLFGAGFFGLELGEAVSHFAHNTIMQMIGACGLFGIIAYFIYRIETIFLYTERPTLFKTMLGLSAAALVIASLLDIFLFSFFSMIYHSALLALTVILNREQIASLSPKTKEAPKEKIKPTDAR